MRKIVLAAAALAATGCKGTDTPPAQPFCNAFANQTAVVETCATNCTFSAGSGAEVDKNLDTAVSITPTGGSTTDTAKIRVSGDAMASGALAGVFVNESAATTSITRTIRTYLNNVQQESGTGSALSARHTQGGTTAAGYIGLQTTRAFDSVEYEVTTTYNSPDTPVYNVFEICADGDVQ